MEINATIILQIVIFMTLLLWLSPMLFAPILRLFDERERRIEGAKLEASKMSLLADEKAKAFDEQYQKARLRARESLSNAKFAMEKEHRAIIEQAKLLAKEKVAVAEAELKREESRVRPELDHAVSKIAEDIIQALIKRVA